MKRHIKIYMKFWGFGEQDYMPCENCTKRAMTDVHHIDPRGMGGDPTGSKDRIDNLIGLCRECHEEAEINPEFNHALKLLISNEQTRRTRMTNILRRCIA